MLLLGPGKGRGELVVGLVNNMPPSTMRQTEAQFTRLLQDASAGLTVRLRCFAPRPVSDPHYEAIGELWGAELDGLIVTGAEPQAEAMAEEPLWPLLSRLTEWAAAHTRGALFSCLAAHAVVYQVSGLARRRLPAKLSGVYPCSRAVPHAWTAEQPLRWPVPHSRHNDVPLDALGRAGYRILSTGPALGEQDGADSFTMTVGQSQFLLLQGHPEYGGDSLFREFRRDIRRFLDKQRPDWPAMPRDYFDADTQAAMKQLERDSAGRSPADVMADFAARVTTMPVPRWHDQGTRLLSGWLGSLAGPSAAGSEALALAVL